MKLSAFISPHIWELIGIDWNPWHWLNCRPPHRGRGGYVVFRDIGDIGDILDILDIITFLLDRT
jgi:hypothetical protein